MRPTGIRFIACPHTATVCIKLQSCAWVAANADLLAAALYSPRKLASDPTFAAQFFNDVSSRILLLKRALKIPSGPTVGRFVFKHVYRTLATSGPAAMRNRLENPALVDNLSGHEALAFPQMDARPGDSLKRYPDVHSTAPFATVTSHMCSQPLITTATGRNG